MVSETETDVIQTFSESEPTLEEISDDETAGGLYKIENQKYVCEYEGCEKEFGREDERDSHAFRDHGGLKKFYCKVDGCVRKYAVRKAYRIHCLTNHPDLDLRSEYEPKERQLKRQYKCDREECDKEFLRRDELDRHVFQEHTKEKAFACNIDGCKRDFVTLSAYRRHFKSYHHTQIECKKDGCLEKFTDRSLMQAHFQKVHSDEKKYACSTCKESFHRKLQLKRHMSKSHTNQYPHVCNQCQKGFVRGCELNRHQKSHDVKQCPICSKTFPNWSQLIAHKRNNHPEEKICETCGKTFYGQRKFTLHQEIHSSTRPIFKCEHGDCEKFYYSLNNLRTHVKTKHFGIKFPCTYEGCKKELTSKAKQKHHMLVHERSAIQTKIPNPKFKPSKFTGGHQISTASKLAAVRTDTTTEKMLIAGKGDKIQVDVTVVSTSGTESEAAQEPIGILRNIS